MSLFDIAASLSLDTSGFEKGISGAKTAAGKIGSGLKTAGKIGAQAIGAITTASAALTGTLIKGTSQTATYGDNIDKMSQKIGISAEAYQEWDAILQHSGASVDSLQTVMKTLANQAQKGSDAFEKLGISQEEVATLSQEDLFSKVVAGLQNMEEGTERTALASKLLGRGATELGALLNTSAEDTEAMRQKVHELGGVMSNEAVKDAAKYSDTLQDMKTAFSGLSRNITSEFMPSITGVMDGLTDIFSGNSGSGIGKIQEGINGIAENITNALPAIIEVGSRIITSLIGAITTALPNILSSGTSVIQSFVVGLVQNLPAIIEAGVQLLSAIVSGITQNIGVVTDAIVQIVLALGQGFITMLPDIMTAGISILTGLIQGITESLPELIPVVIDVIMAIVDALIENIDLLVQAGVDLFVALVQNMPEIISAVIEALTELLGAIVEEVLSLGDELGEIFSAIWDAIKEIFKPVVDWFKGIWDGIKRVFSVATQWFKNIFSGAWNGIKTAWSAVGAFFSNVWTKVKQPFLAVGSWFSNIFRNAWTGIKNAFATVGSFFSTVWSAIKKPFNTVATWFKDTFKRAWEGVKNVFSAGGKIFDGIKEGIANVFKTVVNGIIRGINKVVAFPFNTINSILDKLRNIKIVGLKPFSWIGSLNVPQIPELARGGVLKRGEVGLLEGNGAEAVVPLDQNREWIHKVAEDMSREMQGNVTINMTIYGAEGQDVKQLAELVSNRIMAQVERKKAVFA